MNEEKILKLLKSTNEGDVLIGLSLLAKLENIREFIRTHGNIMEGQSNSYKYKEYGERFRIPINTGIGCENVYYKVKDNLYILTGPGYYSLSECYENYSKDVKVINH